MGKGEFDLKIRAEQLGLSLERLTDAVESEFYGAVRDLANGAYARIIAEAQAKLHSTRKDYLKGLQFSVVGENQYLIHLEGSFPEAIEAGRESFDLRETLLKSNKIVEIGSRAGLPWVQKNKKGGKFAHVPLERKPFSKEPKVADMAAAIRQMEAFNASGRKQKITKIFTDASGRPMQGKVAKAANFSGLDKTMQDLEGLVKYQKVHRNEKTGKETVHSVYINYRTIAQHGKPWIHPGLKPLGAFPQAEEWLERELDQILKTFLG